MSAVIACVRVENYPVPSYHASVQRKCPKCQKAIWVNPELFVFKAEPVCVICVVEMAKASGESLEVLSGPDELRKLQGEN